MNSGEGAIIWRARFYDFLVTLLTLGRERRLREAILERADLSAGERVLDVGCGTGTLAIAIKRRVGLEGIVHGVDASAEMVALAQQKTLRDGREVHYQVAYARSLPFDDASFDAVLCTMVMHHLPKDQRGNAIAEMFRVLRPAGRLIVVDLDREGGVLAAMNPVVLVHGRRSLSTIREAADLILSYSGDVTTGKLGFRSLGYVSGRK